MKKGILAGMILMLGISSFGFSAGQNNYEFSKNKNMNNKYDNNRNERDRYGRERNEREKYERERSEKERKYNEINSRYNQKLSILNDRLTQKNKEIKVAKNQRNVDWRKVDRLTLEKKSIKRDIESLQTAFNNELSKNNLTAYAGRR